MNNENVMVTVCCITYNHEKYIADALNGFLEQITNFKFNILVHDDASTDKTAEIVKEYEKRYPEKIKGIYQSENQYSKGKQVFIKTIKSIKEAKYIALCEGDDYWTDKYKLQKQVDYMESHPDCTFCFTNAKIVDMSGKEEDRIFVPFDISNKRYFDNTSRKYNLGELALLGFIPTASFLFPTAAAAKLPEFVEKNFPAGDLKMSFLFTSQGYAYFINEATCVYRINVSGSATTNWKTYNDDERFQHCQGYIDLYNLIDAYTDFKYTKELFEAKIPFELQKAMITGDKTILGNKLFRKYIKIQPSDFKLKIYLSLYFPKLYKKLKKIKFQTL